MKKLLLLICASLFVAFTYGQGKIGYLSFGSGTSGANNLNPQNNPVEANFKVNDLTTMTVSRGAGMEYANNSTYSYVAYLPAGGNRIDAIANNVYYEVKLNSSAKSMYLRSLTARLRTAHVWTAADVSYRWFYRVGNSAGFTEIGSSDVLLGFTDNNGDIEPTLDLSGIAELQNIAANTDVYFRLYAWGAKAKQEDGTTDVTQTSRGFGFGKSSATTTELITFTGSFNKPHLASWNFGGVNGTSSTTVNSAYQSSLIKEFDGGNGSVTIGRGAGLVAGSLSNAFAVMFGAATADYDEAKANYAYYAIKLQGNATDYTQILGYRMKFRRNSVTSLTGGKWVLVIGDEYNQISGTSEIKEIDQNDIVFTDNADGNYYEIVLNDNDIRAVIPPGKNAELRLYVWGSTSTTLVFGLGRLAGEDHVQIYGKTMTAAEYLQVLPVTLASFKATKQSSSVRLNWSTASEKDNSYFNILRAGDDKQFTSIGRINGSGTTASAKEYSLTDYRPLAGANYYRLSQTDLDGKTSEVGEVQHVTFDLNNTSLTVVSQTDQSGVKAVLNAAKADKASVTVHNVSGSTLYQAQLNLNSGVNEIVAPVNLSKGVYILKVKTQSGDAWQAKFVK